MFELSDKEDEATDSGALAAEPGLLLAVDGRLARLVERFTAEPALLTPDLTRKSALEAIAELFQMTCCFLFFFFYFFSF